MDKSCHSSVDSTTSNGSNSTHNRDHYLKQLNKISHKISKPVRKPPFDQHNHLNPPPPQPQPQPTACQPPPPQNQPPVYNINKSEFRDVVQRLTGSPAHERFSTPSPINQPKTASSRLQRIRPPPLAQLSNRPPPLLNNAALHPPQNPTFHHNGVRQLSPPSPLPPFPPVHGAADSPISAYMRLLQNSVSTVESDPKLLPGGYAPLGSASARWTNQHVVPPPQGITLPMTSAPAGSSSQYLLPSSPIAFGCFPSPRSPYPLLSPNFLFSPNSGQLGFPPLSPRLQVPSPRWRDL